MMLFRSLFQALCHVQTIENVPLVARSLFRSSSLTEILEQASFLFLTSAWQAQEVNFPCALLTTKLS